MPPPHVIGVIGGMGPYAGLDLVRKIFDNTIASRDQDHVPVALLTYPDRIPDRSRFLFGESDDSPVPAIIDIADRLVDAGATRIAVPCNTAHADPIYGPLTERYEDNANVRFLSIITEAVHHIRMTYPAVERVGVLGTLATMRLELYEREVTAAGLEYLAPEPDVQERVVNRTIYDPPYGIKAQGNPVSPQARAALLEAIDHLTNRGAEVVVLGCTELPLAIPEREIGGTTIIDPTTALARALIRETYPEKLRDA